MARLGRALQQEGGLAVRVESCGVAYTWEVWLQRLDSGLPARLFAAAVSIAREDTDTYFSCGMHHFGLPDVQITAASQEQALAWIDMLCIYQLAEKPTLWSGHTFQPDSDTPRKHLERWPDHRRHPDDGRHNPFGLWRLVHTTTTTAGMVPVPIPTLAATLTAAEREKGAPLTRLEVEALVDKAPCIAMETRDAQALERSRCHADIVPELAWPQWQIVRTWDQ